MRTRLGILTVAALAIAGAACSEDDGGDDGSTARVYVDAMVAAVSEVPDNIFNVGDRTECFASRVVDVIGVDRLERAAIEPDDFASDPDMAALELGEVEVEQLYDAYGRCDVDVRQLIIDAAVTGSDDEDRERDCLEPVLTDERLRTMLTSLFRLGPDAMDEATARGTLDPEIERTLDEMLACFSFGDQDPDGEG